jgi:hypothetical protein
MKPSIITDLSNDIKFRNYTSWSINDIRSHYLPCKVNNHHIDNKDLALWVMKRLIHNEAPNEKAIF